MSRLLHWSLLGGCLGVASLTARPAWDVVCCPSPLASLSSQGCDVRLPESLATRVEPNASEDLALVDAR